MCHLAGLHNQFDDLLSLSLVNRYLERLLVRGGPEKGNRQVVANVCPRIRELRRLEKVDQLSRLSNWLENEEELAHIRFVGEDQVLGFPCSEPGFDGMESLCLKLERIRFARMLVDSRLHLRVRELGEDAVLTHSYRIGRGTCIVARAESGPIPGGLHLSGPKGTVHGFEQLSQAGTAQAGRGTGIAEPGIPDDPALDRHAGPEEGRRERYAGGDAALANRDNDRCLHAAIA